MHVRALAYQNKTLSRGKMMLEKTEIRDLVPKRRLIVEQAISLLSLSINPYLFFLSSQSHQLPGPLKALNARLLHTRRDQRAKDGGAGKLQHAPGARPCSVSSHLSRTASKQASTCIKGTAWLEGTTNTITHQKPGAGGAHIRNERSGTDRISTKDAQSTRSISSDIPHYVRTLKKRYRTTDMHASHQQIQSNLLEKHDIAPT